MNTQVKYRMENKIASVRILSLDGGGILGTFGASVLAEFEDRLDQPIGHYFDFIVGTSTGGIIALSVGMGKSAADVLSLYREHGDVVFTFNNVKPPLHRKLAWGLASRVIPGLKAMPFRPCDFDYPKYESEPLRRKLCEVFHAETLGQAHSRLLIPSVNITTGAPKVFKTPHSTEYHNDVSLPIVDVALATAAAPMFFAPTEISGNGWYCDGGLWANNPAVVGIAEVLKLKREENAFEGRPIEMLSIGTGLSSASWSPEKPPGVLAWLPRLAEFLAISQGCGVNRQVEYLIGKSQVCRIDFPVPSKDWKMDSTDQLEALASMGKAAGLEWWPQVKTRFFSEPTERVEFDLSGHK